MIIACRRRSVERLSQAMTKTRLGQKGSRIGKRQGDGTSRGSVGESRRVEERKSVPKSNPRAREEEELKGGWAVINCQIFAKMGKQQRAFKRQGHACPLRTAGLME